MISPDCKDEFRKLSSENHPTYRNATLREKIPSRLPEWQASTIVRLRML